MQSDSVQQKIRAAPTDADLTIDGKQFRLCVCVGVCPCALFFLTGSACHADDCMMIACFADSMHAVIVSDEHVMCIKCPDPL